MAETRKSLKTEVLCITKSNFIIESDDTVTRPIPFPCLRVQHKEKHVLLHSWVMPSLKKVLFLLLSSVFSLSFWITCF
ncbi:hypothetical protein P8452_74648 [Trifolium repens]|nr:hypothetical protein P8452_74648 [Trifolium repens]